MSFAAMSFTFSLAFSQRCGPEIGTKIKGKNLAHLKDIQYKGLKLSYVFFKELAMKEYGNILEKIYCYGNILGKNICFVINCSKSQITKNSVLNRRCL